MRICRASNQDKRKQQEGEGWVAFSNRIVSTGTLKCPHKAAYRLRSSRGRGELSKSSGTTRSKAWTPRRVLLSCSHVGYRMERERGRIPLNHPKPRRSSETCVCALGNAEEGGVRGWSTGFPTEQSSCLRRSKMGAKAQIRCIYSGKTPRGERWEFCLNKWDLGPRQSRDGSSRAGSLPAGVQQRSRLPSSSSRDVTTQGLLHVPTFLIW